MDTNSGGKKCKPGIRAASSKTYSCLGEMPMPRFGSCERQRVERARSCIPLLGLAAPITVRGPGIEKDCQRQGIGCEMDLLVEGGRDFSPAIFPAVVAQLDRATVF